MRLRAKYVFTAGLLGLLCLMLGAPRAHADTVTLTLENEGGSSSIPLGNNVVGNFYTYPYFFSINGSSSYQPLMCDDFSDDISNGEQWTANVYTLAQAETMGQMTPFGSESKAYAYEAAALLYVNLMGTNESSAASEAYNLAVWGLFYNPANITGYSATYGGTYTPSTLASNALNTVENPNFNTAVLSNVDFYTPIDGTQPVGDGQPQEFIGIVSTPEPSSLLLLGTGLLAMVGLGWRRNSRASGPVLS